MREVIFYFLVGVIVYPLTRRLDSRLHKQKQDAPARKLYKLIEHELKEKGYFDLEGIAPRKTLGTQIREAILGIALWPLALLVIVSKFVRG